MELFWPALERQLGGVYSYIRVMPVISFEINFITKETSWAEPEYMNIQPPPPISVLAPALNCNNSRTCKPLLKTVFVIIHAGTVYL